MASTHPYKVTDAAKAKVIALKSFGVPQAEIALYLGISHDTLERHYRRELDKAQVDANEVIAGSLYNNAKGGDTTAQIFWLKTRGRWRTEDSVKLAESNEELTRELKELRAKLDAQNKREF